MEKYSFENFIMQCCKSGEADLRKFLKRILRKNGFTIKEDDFRSYRGEKYSTVHNMLAVRGAPKVCLVAHTDVCRDHAHHSDPVLPTIKEKMIDGEMRKIIQDKDCNIQVGGDDRLGVAINVWIALNTGYDMSLLFTTDEEIGVVSAEYITFPELNTYDVLVQVDRGNHSNQLVNYIGGRKLCSDSTAKRLLKIAEDVGLPRRLVNGMLTDVLAIKGNNMCKNAVNMTCGYHNSYGSGTDEFIDIEEARDTMKFVSSIIKDYDLNGITIEDLADKIEEEESDWERYARMQAERRLEGGQKEYGSGDDEYELDEDDEQFLADMDLSFFRTYGGG